MCTLALYVTSRLHGTVKLSAAMGVTSGSIIPVSTSIPLSIPSLVKALCPGFVQDVTIQTVTPLPLTALRYPAITLSAHCLKHPLKTNPSAHPPHFRPNVQVAPTHKIKAHLDVQPAQTTALSVLEIPPQRHVTHPYSIFHKNLTFECLM